MGDVGKITIIAKNIKGNAKGEVRYDAKKISNTSGGFFTLNGNESGVNHVPNTAPKESVGIKIVKLEGPFDEEGKLVKNVKAGELYIFKATPSREPILIEIPTLKWAIKPDDKEQHQVKGAGIYNRLIDKKIVIKLMMPSMEEKVKVYAFYEKPVESISVEVRLKLLQHIIIIGTQNHRGDSSLTNPTSWVRDVGPGSKLMFAHQAIRRIRLNKDIKFSVLMCEEGYKSSHLKAVKEAVEGLYGGKFYKVNSAQQIVNYLNTGDKENSSVISNARKESPVRQLFFYSHGIVGKIALGMGLTGDSSDYSFGEEEVKKISRSAFIDDSHIYSFACRTGLGNPDIDESVYDNKIKNSGFAITPMGPVPILKSEKIQMPLYSAQSIAQKISDQTGAITYAFLRRTDYEETLFTKDDLAFSDYMKKRNGDENIELSPKRYGNKYQYLLKSDYKLTSQEEQRWNQWKKTESNYKKIDDAWFDPDGARHNVKAARSPEGVPAEMQTFRPLKK